MEELDLEDISILIVEDDPGILTLLSTFFTARGAVVRTEKDGRNVLSHVKQNNPDLIILDVVMPYVDGFTVLGWLRQVELMTPVIMLTDQSSIDDKVRGLEFGADDYVTKPFSTRELLARAKSLLRRFRSNTSDEILEMIALGSVRISVPAREVVLTDGTQPHFTKTEFDLLCYLARNRDTVVPHSALLKEVMGYKSDIETKALVMHIANIRRKFQQTGQTSLKIESIAGVGYKLVVMEKTAQSEKSGQVPSRN